ncbi:MAG: hypothetical protein IPK07_03845 [Deltaproteobacteria bacterium]|nr:hypothetical protein [Deltaproteobacteria bacterium]
MRLPDISVESLRKAVRIFLEAAYPDGVPAAVLERLGCLTQGDLGTALDCADVEVEEGCDGPRGRFALRLGSSDYPHVRLVLERCSGCDDFVFSVDTHDTHFLFGPEVSADTRQRFEAVQEKNRRLKVDVERGWTAAGLPTFERFIHDGMAALHAPCHETA